MEEIKVGEYVRTKEGYIAKFIHYGYNEGISGKSCLFDSAIRDISYLDYDEDDFLWDSELKEYIVNHSFDIIDLIEVGDYVNGYKVEKKAIGLIYVDYCWDCNLYTMVTKQMEDIKSIVTKEQFESIKYKVGD